MKDYTWVDINSTGLRNAICMIAEKYHNGEEPTNEEVGVILHKTTQRSGLKKATVMIDAVKEMAKVYETCLRIFSKISGKNGEGLPTYKYDAQLNCARFVEVGLCVGISNSIPTVRDFESLNKCEESRVHVILNLRDGKMYAKPVMA